MTAEHPTTTAFMDLGQVSVAHGVISVAFHIETNFAMPGVTRIMNATKFLEQKLQDLNHRPHWINALKNVQMQGIRQLEALVGRGERADVNQDLNTDFVESVKARNFGQGFARDLQVATQQVPQQNPQRPLSRPAVFARGRDPPEVEALSPRQPTARRPGAFHRRMAQGETEVDEDRILSRPTRQLGGIFGGIALIQSIGLNEKVDILVNATDALKNSSVEITNALEMVTDTVQHLTTETHITEAAAVAEAMLDLAGRQVTIITTLATGVAALRRGVLTPEAIPLHVMESTLKRVSASAKQVNVNLKIPEMSTSQAYFALKVKTKDTKTGILAQVEFPVTSHGEPNLVAMEHLPAPIFSHPDVAVKPDPIESILITDGIGAYIMTRTAFDKTCDIIGQQVICEVPIKYKRLQDTCLGALYKGLTSTALRLCPLLPADKIPRIIAIGKNKFLVTTSRPTAFTKSCIGTRQGHGLPSHPSQQVQVYGSKIITVNPGCILDSEMITVKPEHTKAAAEVNLIFPKLEEPDVKSWDIVNNPDDRLVTQTLAMIHGNISSAIKYEREASTLIKVARSMNISDELLEFATMVNNTVMTPVLTLAEGGVKTIADVVDTALGALSIITHPSGLFTIIGVCLFIIFLIVLLGLAAKMGLLNCNKCRRTQPNAYPGPHDPNSGRIGVTRADLINECKRVATNDLMSDMEDKLRSKLDREIKEQVREAVDQAVAQANAYTRDYAWKTFKQLQRHCRCLAASAPPPPPRGLAFNGGQDL